MGNQGAGEEMVQLTSETICQSGGVVFCWSRAQQPSWDMVCDIDTRCHGLNRVSKIHMLKSYLPGYQNVTYLEIGSLWM